MCRLLQVSASGFYAWRDRPRSSRRRADIGLAAKIPAIYRRSQGRYGSPNSHAERADDHDIHVGCKRVARWMRENGLRSIVAPNYVVTTTPGGAPTANADLLNRQFKAAGPNQLWVADATSIPIWAGMIYLAIVPDVWSHKIVGWAIDDHLRTQLMLDALNMALVQRRPKNVIQPRVCSPRSKRNCSSIGGSNRKPRPGWPCSNGSKVGTTRIGAIHRLAAGRRTTLRGDYRPDRK